MCAGQSPQALCQATLPADLPPTGSAPSGSFSYYLVVCDEWWWCASLIEQSAQVVVVLPGRQQCEPPLLLPLKSSTGTSTGCASSCHVLLQMPIVRRGIPACLWNASASSQAGAGMRLSSQDWQVHSTMLKGLLRSGASVISSYGP